MIFSVDSVVSAVKKIPRKDAKVQRKAEEFLSRSFACFAGKKYPAKTQGCKE